MDKYQREGILVIAEYVLAQKLDPESDLAMLANAVFELSRENKNMKDSIKQIKNHWNELSSYSVGE